MLPMAAAQLRHPVTLLVLMESGDFLRQRPASESVSSNPPACGDIGNLDYLPDFEIANAYRGVPASRHAEFVWQNAPSLRLRLASFRKLTLAPRALPTIHLKRRMSSSDLVTIFRSEVIPTAEMEAIAIQNLLESNGISALLVGDSVLPYLPFEVKVPAAEADRAKQLISEAEQAGPAAAEAAELESER
jgi:hypothetical protein